MTIGKKGFSKVYLKVEMKVRMMVIVKGFSMAHE